MQLEVVTYIQSTGDGWQARVDGVLREHVPQQARRSMHTGSKR